MASGIDETLNWVINHWYYWVIIVLSFFMFSWWQELNRFKRQFIRWCQDRQEKTIIQEQKSNPSTVFKKIIKMHPFSDKGKIVARIISYSEEPIEVGNPKPAKDVFVRIVAKTNNLLNLFWWKPMNYAFIKSDVYMDERNGIIRIPARCFWERNWDGTLMLISPHLMDVKEWVDDKLYKDLHEAAVDGYASQMTSYSSVKPTWGHEERLMEKEGEARSGFYEQLPIIGKKKKGFKNESSE